jgi:hypothetical protein
MAKGRAEGKLELWVDWEGIIDKGIIDMDDTSLVLRDRGDPDLSALRAEMMKTARYMIQWG